MERAMRKVFWIFAGLLSLLVAAGGVLNAWFDRSIKKAFLGMR